MMEQAQDSNCFLKASSLKFKSILIINEETPNFGASKRWVRLDSILLWWNEEPILRVLNSDAKPAIPAKFKIFAATSSGLIELMDLGFSLGLKEGFFEAVEGFNISRLEISVQ